MKHPRLIGFAVCLATLGLTACGQDSYRASTDTQRQSAPGYVNVPSKVDIVMAIDDTGSMKQAFDAINSQSLKFLQNLEATGWDYRFSVIPLVAPRNISQIAVSRYDGNFAPLNLWLSPYPGAKSNGFNMSVNPTMFRAAQAAGSAPLFSEWIPFGSSSSNDGTSEPGLANIGALLNGDSIKKNQLRPDSLLVVIPITDGQDTSGLSGCSSSDLSCSDWIHRSDGFIYPNPTKLQQGYTDAYNKILSTKGNANLIRMYSVTSSVNGPCISSDEVAKVGTRYADMAKAFAGTNFDLCSSPISTTLTSIQSQLSSVRLSMKTRFLIIDKAPNVSTIKVVVTRADGTVQNIAQDATNGWTFRDDLNDGVHGKGYGTVNTVEIQSGTTTIGMNSQTGYVIELHGSAILNGNDVPNVTYTAASVLIP